jgi:hypothetical protein
MSYSATESDLFNIQAILIFMSQLHINTADRNHFCQLPAIIYRNGHAKHVFSATAQRHVCAVQFDRLIFSRLGIRLGPRFSNLALVFFTLNKLQFIHIPSD